VRSEYFNSGLSKYILTVTVQSQRKNEVKTGQ